MSDYVVSVEIRSAKHIQTRNGQIQLWVSVATVILLVSSLFMDWFTLGYDGAAIFSIKAHATGFDFWVVLTILAVMLSVGLSIKSPSRWGGVLLAWFGSWWLLLAAAALTSQSVFVKAVSLFYDLPALFQEFDIPFVGTVEAYAFEIGSAWYALLFIALILLGGATGLLFLAHHHNLNESGYLTDNRSGI